MSLNHELVLKASKALLKHVENKKDSEQNTNLFADDEEVVHLVISLKKITGKERHKPYRIPLRVPMYRETSSVCLITKGNDNTSVEALKELNIPQIKEVITVLQLKTEYKSYEVRRQLIAQHDLFLTDDRVINSLPEILGVKFFKAKKTPAPVNLLASDVEKEIKKALSCTYYRQGKGTCNAAKIGMTTMAAPELADNIECAMNAIVKCISKGWDNIQSVGIKTGKSLTLPIYNSLPNPPTTIDASVAKAETSKNNAAKKTEKADAKKQAKKSKKSPLSRPNNAAEKAQPKKRAAATAGAV
ncbi:proteasome-interacting protein cic1 [Coemansia sp. RSA 1813]|nr:proteasome-interacting protein cic1 [Coemansia sp. RSA 1646]KAJ1769808.1 proteasome-interacting protein cic1 [Coemansia sp. RSA 1843]KAJ2091260.1 proteasome-interacting protein cic1 [Coemansia sp. RSA 986]KAJ2216448.1 proteasome-interacting protein cic1 [Coemansia sp. RSA 487]KAJ2571468.1 proteasome-interacting protein cic1 [Coemansia sp. RSA 1813]